MGFLWGVLEHDDFGNAARWPDFKDACYAHGLLAGVWMTDSWNLVNCPVDAQFVIGEIESEGDRQGAINAIGKLPEIPKAVLISGTAFSDPLGAPQPDKAKPLIDAGYSCLVEVYPDETNEAPQMAFLAQQLGWPSSQPVFHSGQRPLSYYQPWMEGGWGCYLAEYVPGLKS